MPSGNLVLNTKKNVDFVFFSKRYLMLRITDFRKVCTRFVIPTTDRIVWQIFCAPFLQRTGISMFYFKFFRRFKKIKNLAFFFWIPNLDESFLYFTFFPRMNFSIFEQFSVLFALEYFWKCPRAEFFDE